MQSSARPPPCWVDVPRFRRAFFCIPLREALIAWGLMQVAAIVVTAALGVVHLVTSHHVDGQKVALQFLWAVLAAVDVLIAALLVRASRKDNARQLNACYTYCTGKVCAYAAALLLSLLTGACCYSDNWYYQNLDPVHYFLFRGNPAIGVIDLLLQGYLALLVRSQVQALGGAPRLRSFRLRLQLVYDPEPEDDELPIAYEFPGADKLPEKTDRNNLHSVE